MSVPLFRLSLAMGLGVYAGAALAQTAPPTDVPAGNQLEEVVVTAKRLDAARDAISPSLGASDYVIDSKAIQNTPQGVNASFNQVLLQAPGVSQDSYGQLHIRNEHANLQYRINGIILPEGISGFGQALDPRFAESIDLMTGTLPAQYGYRTAGIVDIQTKSGAFDQGGEVSLYGGSHGEFQPSFTASGSSGAFNYYVSGSYLEDDLGVENPTASHNPIHDHTTQFHGFAYLSYIPTSDARVSAMLGTSIGFFQIPNNPNQTPNFTDRGVSTFNSADLNENQREINHYAIVALQISGDRLDYQIAPFTRYSETKFSPDPVGDLVFNGFADRSQLSSWSSGIQSDASYKLTDNHTLRFGTFFSVERSISQVASDVFPIDPLGNQASDIPFRISDQSSKTGYLYGLYLQDEWALNDTVTLNFGGRFDIVNAYTNENQISPRINLVWKPDEDTTVHIGYSRDFTPPPQELVASQSVDRFVGTTKQPEVLLNGQVKAEREHYFDAGFLRTVLPGLDLGLDTYYKIKRNLLDEGQFGESLVESPFNYAFGRAYGVEATASYRNGPLSLYANVAYGEEKGKDIVSSQFFFAADELAYIHNHAIYTDHDQPWTISGGGSFTFSDAIGQMRTSFDLIFGSGLRASPDNAVEPNGEKLPSYTQVNIGLAQDIETNGAFAGTTVRFDIVNLFDESYEIRDGTGVGVGAPQFGPRRAFYAGVSKSF
ncbi:MAG TPA: TonB-dependent receptor [Alphaproteobacteria bacterium]|jgi:outer membrane receptor protein involved in Fe transport|nr:TonB-dependent receptor [Alphaproteobacteria bacterium]